MHFANIMAEPTSDGEYYKITAILDWEFSGVVPSTRWDPTKAFLRNGQRSPQAKEEKNRLWYMFEHECRKRGAEHLLEDLRPNTVQEKVQNIVSHIRAIVEACAKGNTEDLEKVKTRRVVAEEAMMALIED